TRLFDDWAVTTFEATAAAMETPLLVLPAITFRDCAVAPPIVLFDEPLMRTPLPPFADAIRPVVSVPIKFPSMKFPALVPAVCIPFPPNRLITRPRIVFPEALS